MTRKNRRVFMDVSIDGDPVEKMVFELFYDVAPKTAENFRALCTGEKGISPHVGRPLHYKGCFFHHIVKGSMAQGGDFYKRDGSFGESIYGEKFPDESPSKLKHDERGLLSMSIADRDTRGSLFAITFRALDYLDRKNVVFGKVVKGDEVLEKIENVGDDDNGTPAVTVKIINCGEYSEDKKRTRSSRVSKHKKSSRGRRKKRRYYSSESETSTDSETDSSESESESDSESDISSSSDFSSSSDDRRKKRKRSSKKDKFKRNKRRNKRRERKRRNRDKRVKHTSKRSSISSESESSEDNGGAANDGKVGTESLAPKEKVASLPNQNREDIGWEKGELRRENGLRQRTHSNGAKANSRSRSISPNPATSKRVSISPRKTLSPNIGKIRPESKSLSRSPSESGRVIPVKGSPTLPPPPPRRSLSPSPVRPAPKNTSRSPIRFSLRNVNKSLMRGVSKAISRSPVRYARRSVSKSPVRPPQRSISKSPVRSSRKNMSISRSPIRGQKRNYTRSRSRSPVKSYARRYRSPTPDRSPVRSYRYGRSDRDSRRSPPRRYRSPPKHRSPLRYRSRRSGTRSPVRSFSPVVALRLRNSPRVERRKSLSHSSASRSSSDPPPPPKRKTRSKSISSSASGTPPGNKGTPCSGEG